MNEFSRFDALWFLGNTDSDLNEDELARFKALARQAREEAPPSVDVTARVLARIQEDSSVSADEPPAVSGPHVLRPEPDDEWRQLWIGALIAVAAASIAAMLFVPAWNNLNDPLADWSQQYDVVMQ